MHFNVSRKFMNSNEEIEIDLLRMCRHIFSKWKVILLCGLVFALSGFTYKYLSYEFLSVPLADLDKQFKIEREEKQPNGSVQKITSKVSYRIYKEDYDSKLAKYNADMETYSVNKKLYCSKIAQSQKELDSLNDYLSNSKIYNASDDSYYETVFLYTIRDTKNQTIELNQLEKSINSGVIYASSFVSSSEFAQEISRNLKLESDINLNTARELVSIELCDKDTFRLIVKADSASLMNLLLKSLDTFNEKLSGFCDGKYKLDYQEISSGIGELSNLDQFKKKYLEKLSNLQKELSDIKVEASSVVEPIPFEGYGKLASLEGYKVQKILLYVFAGLIFGIIAPCCVYAAIYLFDGKLKDENYLTNVFDLNKIACLHSREGAPLNHSELTRLKANLDYVRENLGDTIVFVSSLADSEDDCLMDLNKFIESYSMSAANISIVPVSSLKEIISADAVIIAERLDVSALDSVADEIRAVMAVNVKLHGVVLI